ncbi:MAG: hypothetical protein LBS10_03775 [Gracilibacteraceae bacterium]|jgi:polyferredoxin|nr:hypothetical protein [Gracilibacteraceae bacterium]
MSKKKRKNSNYQTTARSAASQPVKGARRGKGLTIFEIMMISLVAAWVLAFLLTQQMGVPIHSWVTLATYLGSGALLMLRPITFVEYLAKRNEALLRDEPRVLKLNRRVRVVALVLLVMGFIFAYMLFNDLTTGSGAYGVDADTGVYGEAADTAEE